MTTPADGPGSGDATHANLRRAITLVAALNLAYFCVEFAVARAIGSVSLFADSIDFLEDTAVNVLVLIALGWPARYRSAMAVFLAGLLLVPSALALWAAWQKFLLPAPPAALPLSLAGLGALAVNVYCALVLARVRHHGGSLMKAAYLSARNDAAANVAIVAAGALTFLRPSVWPDLIVGMGIFLLNLGAVREVLQAVARETPDARP